MVTQAKVELSPHVPLLDGQTVTHILVELSENWRVPLLREGHTKTQIPSPVERSAKLYVGHTSTQVFVWLSAYFWRLPPTMPGGGQTGRHCRL